MVKPTDSTTRPDPADPWPDGQVPALEHPHVREAINRLTAQRDMYRACATKVYDEVAAVLQPLLVDEDEDEDVGLAGIVRLVIDRLRAGQNQAIADELLSIADAYDRWHEDQVARILAGNPTMASGMIPAYRVRDQLRDRADDLTRATPSVRQAASGLGEAEPTDSDDG